AGYDLGKCPHRPKAVAHQVSSRLECDAELVLASEDELKNFDRVQPQAAIAQLGVSADVRRHSCGADDLDQNLAQSVERPVVHQPEICGDASPSSLLHACRSGLPFGSLGSAGVT